MHIAPVDAPWRNWGTDGDSIGAGREYGPVSYTHLTLPTICSV